MSDLDFVEEDQDSDAPDPDANVHSDKPVNTQPYDLIVETLIHQIENGSLFLRPNFQRGYVWPPKTASRLIESILLNIPIPPCYLAQNDDFEIDVIDGQQRLTSISRFVDNQFQLTGLEVLTSIIHDRWALRIFHGEFAA